MPKFRIDTHKTNRLAATFPLLVISEYPEAEETTTICAATEKKCFTFNKFTGIFMRGSDIATKLQLPTYSSCYNCLQCRQKNVDTSSDVNLETHLIEQVLSNIAKG